MKARIRGMADFARRAGLNGACLVAGVLLLVVVGVTAWREWSVLALRREVASMEDSLAQRRLQQEREQRRNRPRSEIEALLSRQRPRTGCGRPSCARSRRPGRRAWPCSG